MNLYEVDAVTPGPECMTCLAPAEYADKYGDTFCRAHAELHADAPGTRRLTDPSRWVTCLIYAKSERLALSAVLNERGRAGKARLYVPIHEAATDNRKAPGA